MLNDLYILTKNNLFCFQNERNNAGSTPNNENTIPDKSSPLLAAFSEVTNTLLEESSQHHWISGSTKIEKWYLWRRVWLFSCQDFLFQETPKLRNSITYYLVNDEYVFWQKFFFGKKRKNVFVNCGCLSMLQVYSFNKSCLDQ